MKDIKENNSIDLYIQNSRTEVRDKLCEIRNIIKKSAPDAIEKISWGMPTFWQDGNICHFALFNNHIGFYPGSRGIEKFIDELGEYKTSKGAVQFPINKPMPKELISRIVKFRVEENIRLFNEKNKKK